MAVRSPPGPVLCWDSELPIYGGVTLTSLRLRQA
jgi:hypothetical protein